MNFRLKTILGIVCIQVTPLLSRIMTGLAYLRGEAFNSRSLRRSKAYSSLQLDLPEVQPCGERLQSLGQATKDCPPFAAHLLLVEDSPVNQVILSAMLCSGGHKVDIADSGFAAIAAVRIKRYDLIFMDVSMPDMDGMDAARSIRQLGGAISGVPIIAMTAYAVKGYREQCIASGMNDYATKPISKKDLLALVDQWRDSSKAELMPIATNDPAAGIALLDEAVLRQVAEDAGEDDITYFLRIFIKELKLRRNAIALALDQRDLTVLSHEAHALKSGAATFGAWSLHELAAEMNACCKYGDLAAVLPLAEKLLLCVEATLAALERRCR